MNNKYLGLESPKGPRSGHARQSLPFSSASNQTWGKWRYRPLNSIAVPVHIRSLVHGPFLTRNQNRKLPFLSLRNPTHVRGYFSTLSGPLSQSYAPIFSVRLSVSVRAVCVAAFSMSILWGFTHQISTFSEIPKMHLKIAS